MGLSNDIVELDGSDESLLQRRTWNLDLAEGATVEEMKWSSQHAIPDPVIEIPEDIVGHIMSFIYDKRGYHYIDYKRRKRN